MTAFARRPTMPLPYCMSRLPPLVRASVSPNSGAREGGELVFAAQAERRAKERQRPTQLAQPQYVDSFESKATTSSVCAGRRNDGTR